VLSTKLFKDGDITSKVQVHQSMLLPTTETFNTSPQPRSSCDARLDGLNTFRPSTSSFAFTLANSAPSLTR